MQSEENLSVGQAFYKHLMSGVSQMLSFVIGGGIMIALAFLFDNILGVPKDSLGDLGSYHEISSIFMKIGQAAFGFMIPVFAGFLRRSEWCGLPIDPHHLSEIRSVIRLPNPLDRSRPAASTM